MFALRRSLSTNFNLLFDPQTVSRIASFSSCVSHQNIFNKFIHLNYDAVSKEHQGWGRKEVLQQLVDDYKRLSSDQKNELKDVVSEGDDKLKEKKKHLRYAHQHGMPRRPPSSGMALYLKEKLSNIKGGSLKDGSERFAAEVSNWQNLSAEQREVRQVMVTVNAYTDRVNFLKADFHRDIGHWATKNDVRFSKRLSLLSSRFYSKYCKSAGSRLSKD